jgi:hypothetical protein
MPTHRTFFGLVVLLALALAGCSGGPSPALSPTPTGFVSEQDAAAAAEETYRAYVAEVNRYYNGEPGADSTTFLTGEALTYAKELHAQEKELGLTASGEQKVLSVETKSVAVVAGAASVDLTVCLDVSDTRVLDADGNDVTPARKEVRALDVRLVSEKDALLIMSSTTNDGVEC